MRPPLVLAIACLLLLIQCLTFPRTRFVEDEGWNSDISMTWMREGRLRMSSFPANMSGQVDARPPLLAFAIGETFRWLGAGVLQARLSSILAGMGVVIVAYFLGMEWGGVSAAWVAALLMACDNLLLITARSARPEPHTTLFACLGILLYYVSRRKNSAWWTFLAAVSIGIAVNFHPLGIGFAMAGGVLLLVEPRGVVVRSARRPWRRVCRRVAAYVLGLAVSIAPYGFWLTSDDLHRAGFRATYMSRAVNSSLWQRLAGETERLADFVGLGSQRLPLPFHIPYRLHIALIVTWALVYLLGKRPRLAGEIAVLLVVNFLWWMFMVNKSPRYITTLAPVLVAMVSIALAAAAKDVRWRRTAIAAGLLFGVSQLAGNAFLLYRYRNADYEAVARGLRAVIPAGAPVYGIITFYLALNDRTYYSYDRTPFAYAMTNLRPPYLILYDRVMMHGSGHGEDNFRELRGRETEFVRAHATLAGRVSNEFYGDLEVYRVNGLQ